jgi:hypothetical protein
MRLSNAQTHNVACLCGNLKAWPHALCHFNADINFEIGFCYASS